MFGSPRVAFDSDWDDLDFPGEGGEGVVSYEDSETGSVATLLEVAPNRHILEVETPPSGRGKGGATRAIKEILQQAQRQGWTVVLQPHASTTSPMSDEELESWYRDSFGFEWEEGEEGLWMVKYPEGSFYNDDNYYADDIDWSDE